MADTSSAGDAPPLPQPQIQRPQVQPRQHQRLRVRGSNMLASFMGRSASERNLRSLHTGSSSSTDDSASLSSLHLASIPMPMPTPTLSLPRPSSVMSPNASTTSASASTSTPRRPSTKSDSNMWLSVNMVSSMSQLFRGTLNENELAEAAAASASSSSSARSWTRTRDLMPRKMRPDTGNVVAPSPAMFLQPLRSTASTATNANGWSNTEQASEEENAALPRACSDGSLREESQSLTLLSPSFEPVDDVVYENQRNQTLLGWGSRARLTPSDPDKYTHYVRLPSASASASTTTNGSTTTTTPTSVKPRRRRSHSFSELMSASAFEQTGERIEVVESFAFPDITLPEAPSPSPMMHWEWVTPWHLDAGDDKDGWVYASSFREFTFRDNDRLVRRATTTTTTTTEMPNTTDSGFMSTTSTNEFSTHGTKGGSKFNVRRRKWVRTRRLFVTNGVNVNNGALETEENRETLGLSLNLNLSLTDVSAFDERFLDSMCGWLRKYSTTRKSWSLRYFVLEKSILRCYKDETRSRFSGEVLLFHPSVSVRYLDIHVANDRANAFVVESEDYQLWLQANSTSDREHWMFCIEDALLCRDSYIDSSQQAVETREAVQRRRRLGCIGLDPENAVVLDSTAIDVETLQNPTMLRLINDCGDYLNSKQVAQQTDAFIAHFKNKYSAAAASPAKSAKSNSLPRSRSRRSMTSDSTLDSEPLTDGEKLAAQLVEPRNLMALNNYSFFLSRAMDDVMTHLNHVLSSLVPGACSPSNMSLLESFKPFDVKVDWDRLRKMALSKLECMTFLPIQDILYSLLEQSLPADAMALFRQKHQWLATQEQEYFEINPDLKSPSNWQAAVRLLRSMDNCSLPSEKSTVLRDVTQAIYRSYTKEHPEAASMKVIAADDFVPIFVYVVAHAHLQNAIVTLHLLDETMVGMSEIGESGYYVATLANALNQIVNAVVPEEHTHRKASSATA